MKLISGRVELKLSTNSWGQYHIVISTILFSFMWWKLSVFYWPLIILKYFLSSNKNSVIIQNIPFIYTKCEFTIYTRYSLILILKQNLFRLKWFHYVHFEWKKSSSYPEHHGKNQRQRPESTSHGCSGNHNAEWKMT